ncbi:hypothetical protein B0H10DRAFT_130598 [Mycena sp. CBHHK59/15]|nr:hypothetical protein B0H10DRAFT_130598 [Mycena sp. CBHHK59/15]
MPLESVNNRMVIKFAMRHHDKVKLRTEDAVYTKLGNAGVSGILRPVCLFEDVGGEHGILALVMPFAGTSLANLASAMLTKHVRNGFVDILKNMHDAGFLHDDLCAGKLLVEDNDLSPTIICLGNAQERGPRDSDSAADTQSWQRMTDRDRKVLETILHPRECM